MKLNTHAMEKLSNHDWPGNIRELQHSIEKAVIMCDAPVLKPTDFTLSPVSGVYANKEMTLDEMEHKLISDTLRRYGNISIVAGKLGITRQTLYNKMKKYNIS